MIKRLSILLLLGGACNVVWAQGYQTTYNNTDITNVSIQHKQPKWVALHKEKDYSDDFNENGWVVTESGESIQATNLYVDTIYMHKGTSITLEVPYRKNSNTAVANYVRWFDFRSDGNYNCNLIGREDLLTMTEFSGNGGSNGASSNNYVYRFANGYVGGWGLTNSNTPYGANFYYPTDAEFNSIRNSSFNNGDNNYYVVACDASQYKDFANTYVAGNGGSTFGRDNGWYEPTLSSRALFYIIGIEDATPPEGFEHHWCLTTAEYQGGGNDVDADGNYLKKYLEEYEITFPARRTSINTNELVTLSKDPQAYAIPGLSNSSNDNSTLNVAFATGEANGLTLVNTTRTGTNRVIQFYKDTSKAQWKVEDKSTATILVTKTVNGTIYNIARYKLTFREDVTPLTQTQVAGLSQLSGNETYWWKNLTHRSPEYMETNYEKITSLTFSYDTQNNASDVLNGGMSYAYPFPLDWNYCGYAFYDGSSATDINATNYSNTGSPRVTSYTQWGMYSIVNDYIGYGDLMYLRSTVPPTGTAKDDGGYWLYVDASDRPGSLAELTFEERLCQGSELFGTAWIKSASRWSSNTGDDDGAVLFTIMGVTKDENGNEIHEPIYRQCSGQIMITNYLTSPMDETGLSSRVTGKGEGTNEWFQLYFSFVNSGNVDYDHYTLKIDNYCASTGGGDYYFDEVKIYVLSPSVEVAQLEPICTADESKTLMRIDVDYEAIMSRLGYDPEDYIGDEENRKTASVDFVIINEAQYRNTLATLREEGTEITDAEREKAFKDVLVTFYDSTEKEHQFPTLDFYLNYNLNKKYDDANPGTNQVVFGTDKDDDDEGEFYWRTTQSGLIELSVDCLTDMLAYTEYVILLEPHTETDKTDVAKLDEFIAILDDECAIKTEFYLTSTTILKLNGETVNPSANHCAGQEFVISPEVTYTDPTTGETIYIDGVYFDWFFGSRDEYVAANEAYGGVSLEEALLAFRTYYPNADELSQTDTPPVGEGEVAFTQNHYDIIAYYLEQERRGGMNNMLVLHESHLDMRVLYTGLELIVQPIEVYLEDEKGEPLVICFGYVPMTLYASSEAPILKAGFSNINYPNTDYEPCLRLGLAQFEKCSEKTPFTIHLHGATYVTEADENGAPIVIDHLGVAEGMDMLFLVDTDDPAYRDIILGKEDGAEIVIGKVTRLFAKEDNSNDPRTDAPIGVDGSYMQIYFYGQGDEGTSSSITPFSVREGYYYVASVYFQEKGAFDDDNNDEPMGTACWGTFPLEIKVVPEYLVWQGDKTDNWNNDNHWRRADKGELNKPSSDPYPTNEENGTDNGFVPMLFSKVVIPKDGMAELYMAGFKEGTDKTLSWEGDDDTANHGGVSEYPSSNIMYDLMVYEGADNSLSTEYYRVNLCDQIHFEPGAQLLHSELLLVDKVWTEVKIPQGEWQLVATPLNSVYSGDWYTKTAYGSETAEYFGDIYWSETDNYRYDPDVYQRSWDRAGAIVVSSDSQTSTSDRATPAYVSTGWTSAYNDASEPFTSGVGFSLEGWSSNTTDSIMFRFPKADTEYAYTSGRLNREGEGTLLISQLVDRQDPDKDADDVYTSENLKVSLTTNTLDGNNYYIIGNPFTAYMSMAEFMRENTDVNGYWTGDDIGPIAGNREGTSSGTDDYLLPPHTGFFVYTDETNEPLSISFTRDMQTLGEETRGLSPAPNRFAIRATNGVGITSASLAYDDSASDDYYVGEDVMMMEDTSWQRDGLPLVYTVAGDMAVSVNKVSNMPLIPLGVFADDDCAYTLSFVGIDKLNEPSLIDAYEETETPITEGYTLSMTGPSHGRYFIHSQGAATEISLTENEVFDITAYSPTPGTVIVSSTAIIDDIDVFSVGGMLLRQVNAGGNISCTISGINSGVAIVRARTSEGTFVKKLHVR